MKEALAGESATRFPIFCFRWRHTLLSAFNLNHKPKKSKAFECISADRPVAVHLSLSRNVVRGSVPQDNGRFVREVVLITENAE